MTTLGTYPSNRYARSWITQRVLNRAPELAQIRKSPVSVGQQLLNPGCLYIQETVQMLTRERFNMFASSASLNELDLLHWLELPSTMEFQYSEDSSGEKTYVPPNVYATIDGTEYQITQAENNDIETLSYKCVASRIENASVSHSYTAVLPTTLVANIASVTPNEMPIDSHLYVTLTNNETWEMRSVDKVYYSKCYITGVTRKGTTVTEVVPLRYNGTFKTVNEWHEIESFMFSYVDSTAYVAIEMFPWTSDGQLDTQNILIPAEGGERPLFIDIDTRAWGSTLVGKGFTVSNFDIIRAGIEEKEVFYEMELLDESELNIDVNSFILKPNSNTMYAVDDNNFYVYNTSLEFPNTQNINRESPETKIDLWALRYIYTRGATTTIETRNNAILDPPTRTQWTLRDPDGIEYHMAADGTLSSVEVTAWIDNIKWGEGLWDEMHIPITLLKNGEYIVTLEAQYYNDQYNTSSILTTQFLFFVPAITPEIQFALPAALTTPESIGLDSDMNLWIMKNNLIYRLNIYHDYFLVDYEKKVVWCNEDYASIRVTV